jgi:hypothetical protein
MTETTRCEHCGSPMDRPGGISLYDFDVAAASEAENRIAEARIRELEAEIEQLKAWHNQ